MRFLQRVTVGVIEVHARRIAGQEVQFIALQFLRVTFVKPIGSPVEHLHALAAAQKWIEIDLHAVAQVRRRLIWLRDLVVCHLDQEEQPMVMPGRSPLVAEVVVVAPFVARHALAEPQVLFALGYMGRDSFPVVGQSVDGDTPRWDFAGRPLPVFRMATDRIRKCQAEHTDAESQRAGWFPGMHEVYRHHRVTGHRLHSPLRHRILRSPLHHPATDHNRPRSSCRNPAGASTAARVRDSWSSRAPSRSGWTPERTPSRPHRETRGKHHDNNGLRCQKYHSMQWG